MRVAAAAAAQAAVHRLSAAHPADGPVLYCSTATAWEIACRGTLAKATRRCTRSVGGALCTAACSLAPRPAQKPACWQHLACCPRPAAAVCCTALPGAARFCWPTLSNTEAEKGQHMRWTACRFCPALPMEHLSHFSWPSQPTPRFQAPALALTPCHTHPTCPPTHPPLSPIPWPHPSHLPPTRAPAPAEWVYMLESGFLEMLLQSGHRTLDPEEAGEYTRDGVTGPRQGAATFVACWGAGLAAGLHLALQRAPRVLSSDVHCCLFNTPTAHPADYFYVPVLVSCFIYPVRQARRRQGAPMEVVLSCSGQCTADTTVNPACLIPALQQCNPLRGSAPPPSTLLASCPQQPDQLGHLHLICTLPSCPLPQGHRRLAARLFLLHRAEPRHGRRQHDSGGLPLDPGPLPLLVRRPAACTLHCSDTAMCPMLRAAARPAHWYAHAALPHAPQVDPPVQGLSWMLGEACHLAMSCSIASGHMPAGTGGRAGITSGCSRTTRAAAGHPPSSRTASSSATGGERYATCGTQRRKAVATVDRGPGRLSLVGSSTLKA